MAASNRYMNVDVTWTPSGGTLVALKGIKGATFNDNMEVLQDSADYDVFPTVGGVTFSNPTITFHSIDAFQLYATTPGQLGVLIVTFRDFYSGSTASGGAKIVTMTGAFLASRQRTGQHRQLGTQELMFHANSSDGSTSPVAITAA
jgi:hypothetical protein